MGCAAVGIWSLVIDVVQVLLARVFGKGSARAGGKLVSLAGLDVGVRVGASGRSKGVIMGDESGVESGVELGVVRGERLNRSSVGQLSSWRSSSTGIGKVEVLFWDFKALAVPPCRQVKHLHWVNAILVGQAVQNLHFLVFHAQVQPRPRRGTS